MVVGLVILVLAVLVAAVFLVPRLLAGRIPDVSPRLTAEDGHLTLIEHRVPEVHAWLLERAALPA